MSKALVLKGTDFSTNKVDTVIVTDPVPCTGISLSQSTVTVEMGGTFTLIAMVTPSNTTDIVTWSSSDTTKATVSQGVVTGVAKGTATITVSCGSYSDTCTVTVIAHYTEAVYGSVVPQETRLDYRTGYTYKIGCVFNDPFARKILSGQTVKVTNQTGMTGIYLNYAVYKSVVTPTDKCTASGDDYVLTQTVIDMQVDNAYGVFVPAERLATYSQYVDSRWAGDYTATQDCYITFWFSMANSPTIADEIKANVIAALKIEVIDNGDNA